MKKNTILILTILSLGLSVKVASAANSEKGGIKDQIKKVFNKDYNNEDLLNILANIQKDIKNGETKSLKSRSEELKDYINYRETKVTKHGDKYSEDTAIYEGSRILEIKYGKWVGSDQVLLPLTIKSKPLSVDFSKNKMVLSHFKQNEISEAKVRYVTYDIGNKEVGKDLQTLLSAVEKGKIEATKDAIEELYDDMLIEYDNKVSLVSKIRDNLSVAKYLLENGQAKAAQNSVGIADSLMLRLIEFQANSPNEQKRIKNLRRDLDNVSKVADANYLSEWEKVPSEIKDWFSDKDDTNRSVNQ